MILTNEQIRSVALGAAESVCSPLGVSFYRFRIAHAEAIDGFSSDFGMKAYATAGIRLDLYTDSEFFAFAYDDVKAASSRKWYYFTLLVNGEELARVGSELTTTTGELRVALPKGRNRVTLFFPNLSRARIKTVELSDGAKFKPFKPERRFVFHGDSITHGYDARSAANSYTNRIATACNAEIFNFAIGAACFDPRMIDETSDYKADAVFVAYGTNDWAKKGSLAEFSNDCEAFFRKLNSVHKGAPLFVILPIWRYNYQDEKPVGDFHAARKEIARIATSSYPNARIVDLWENIPKDLALFSDGLHPNDDGFVYYANGVLKHLQKEGFV